jgi:hypothetical protein
MFLDTSLVPAEASCTLRAISCVAAPWCSTAAVIVDAISLIRRIVSPISPTA